MSATHAIHEGEVTRLLHAARRGERDALDRLIPLVYEELRAIARRQLRREHGAPSLCATDVVHEAYLRLAGAAEHAADHTHFFAIAARAMRRVLVDHARRRLADKRGGGAACVTLTEGARPLELPAAKMLELDRALDELEPRQRAVVEYRYFAGLEEAEVARVLGVSERTVRRDWVKARAWLYQALYLAPDD